MKRIIIIDNDPDTLGIVSYIFEESEYHVFKYPNRISVGQIMLDDPDIILLDHYLDGSVGSELCAALKRNPATTDIPVILVSTALQLKDISEDCKADAYVEKPFDVGTLTDLVEKLLNACPG